MSPTTRHWPACPAPSAGTRLRSATHTAMRFQFGCASLNQVGEADISRSDRKLERCSKEKSEAENKDDLVQRCRILTGNFLCRDFAQYRSTAEHLPSVGLKRSSKSIRSVFELGQFQRKQQLSQGRYTRAMSRFTKINGKGDCNPIDLRRVTDPDGEKAPNGIQRITARSEVRAFKIPGASRETHQGRQGDGGRGGCAGAGG